MWFRQAQLFQLTTPVTFDPEMLNAKIAPLAFRPCLASLPGSHGFVSPIEKEGAPLVHAANGYLLICLQIEEKILPATVVRQEVQNRIKDIQAKQDRNVTSREKLALKEDITQTLLPRAFTKLSRTYAYIDTKNNLLVIDSTSAAKIEKFFDLYKKAIGDGSYHAIKTKKISPVLTHWLQKNSHPKSFTIEKSCVLKDPNLQTRITRCQQQDLSANGIQSLLKDGYEAHQLSLNWQDNITFNFADDFTLKSIKYSDEIVNYAKDNYSESKEQEFDGNFYIMTETITPLLLELISLFENDKQKTDETVMEVAYN